MKLTVLADNNTYIDAYYLGEPAVCYYIEDMGSKILFDAGYSDVFIANAEKMGVPLKEMDTVVFSHGHNDHTRGLTYLREYMDLRGVTVVAHPLCFHPKRYENMEIGAPFSLNKMQEICKLRVSDAPIQISENIVFLGEIPCVHAFETRKKIGCYNCGGDWQEDTVQDDSAIVYRGEQGLFIVTGCSHSGICNIVAYAKKVCGDERIAGIIGGFHLLQVDDQLMKTVEYLEHSQVGQLYPCHCVSFGAKAEMHRRIGVQEVGVGMTIEV